MHRMLRWSALDLARALGLCTVSVLPLGGPGMHRAAPASDERALVTGDVESCPISTSFARHAGHSRGDRASLFLSHAGCCPRLRPQQLECRRLRYLKTQ